MSGHSDNESVIALSDLTPGVVLPTNVFDARRRDLLLLSSGTRLTPALLEKLRSRGIDRVVVDSSFKDQISKGGAPVAKPVAPTIRKPARPAPKPKAVDVARAPVPLQRADLRTEPSTQATERIAESRAVQSGQVQSIYQALEMLGSVNGQLLGSVSTDSIGNIVDDIDVVVRATLSPVDFDDASEHCFRVAELAMAVASVMGYPQGDVQALGMGCLIHRGGMTEKAKSLTELNRPLSPTELTEIHKTPCRIFDLLTKVPTVPIVARQVAYQIHERWNGTGYPRQRAGQQIHPLARIAGVCDCYVALTSPRPHRGPLPPYRAVECILKEAKKGLFDAESLRGLLRTVSLYPLGVQVELNDGRTAEVVRANSEAYDRPTVRIINCPTGETYGDVVSLADRRDLRVVRVIDPTTETISDEELMDEIHEYDGSTDFADEEALDDLAEAEFFAAAANRK